MIKRTEVIHSRITKQERDKIGEQIELGGYRNESDFIRKLIQEKICRE